MFEDWIFTPLPTPVNPAAPQPTMSEADRSEPWVCQACNTVYPRWRLSGGPVNLICPQGHGGCIPKAAADLLALRDEGKRDREAYNAIRQENQRLEAQIEALKQDLAFWHDWAVKLEPRLAVFAVEQHLTDEEVATAKAILGLATPDGSDPMAQHRTMTACPLCHAENCPGHGLAPEKTEPDVDVEVDVWVDEEPKDPLAEPEPGDREPPSPEPTWPDRKDIA